MRHHILEPLLVTLHGINRERRHEAPHLAELVVFEREPTYFGGANGGKVGRVGEEDRPLPTCPSSTHGKS